MIQGATEEFQHPAQRVLRDSVDPVLSGEPVEVAVPALRTLAITVENGKKNTPSMSGFAARPAFIYGAIEYFTESAARDSCEFAAAYRAINHASRNS